jgi:Zn-dependent M28 family amino/carboxypeptidase
MKHFIVLSCLTIVLASCKYQKNNADKTKDNETPIRILDSALVVKYANTITKKELQNNLSVFASPIFEGRETGEKGQKLAADFIKAYYINQGISPILDTYFQNIPETSLPKNTKATENVLAYIKGSEKPDEVIVISGHYDHIGIKDNKTYYGADDNGSGTIALLEIAQAFKIAEQNGHAPKRSILFLHVTAEEIGLYGSQYYIDHPAFKLENTIADLNIDMIGRIDEKHKDNPDYIYSIGADRLSKELQSISEEVNKHFFNLTLDYTYNDPNDPNRFYYRSDHYNFAKKNIPVIFYFNGTHKDYHKPTDTPDKINYSLLEKRAQLIFATAWQLANKKDRLVLN